MELKIVYLGKDLKYWRKIKREYEKNYSQLSPTFTQFDLENFSGPRAAMTRIYREKFNVIYIDFSESFKDAIRLAKLLTKNNVTRKFSTVALHELNGARKAMQKTLLAGVRINHIKCVELHDVIYDPVAMLDTELAASLEYAIRPVKQDFKLEQDIRISYVARDHFHVETNAPLTVKKMINVSPHILGDIMPSRRFLVMNESSENLYYNTRFSYDLFFTYKDNDFFKATEKSWMAIVKGLAEYKLKGWDEEFAKAELAKREVASSEVECKIGDWIIGQQGDYAKKPKLKVLVLDESLEIFNQLDAYESGLSFLPEVQTELIEDAYQISRTKPHLIVFHYDNVVNNLEVIEMAVAKINSMEDYEPFLVIFGDDEEIPQIKGEVKYSKLVIHEGQIDIKVIEQLAQKLDAKFHINESGNVAFLNTTQNNPFVTLEISAKYVFLSESIAIFECTKNIPMWTVFKTNNPIDMLLTVIPIPTVFKKMEGPDRYCALINGIGELEKAKLRVAINKAEI